MARQTEALAARGRVGDMEGFVGDLKPARMALAKLVDETTPERLGAALSTPIWLYSEKPAGEGARDGLDYDLNTVEREGLQSLPGIDAETAARIVEERRAHGPYANLAAVSSRVTLAPATATALQSLHRAAQNAGVYTRR
jgi:hypothetical protein